VYGRAVDDMIVHWDDGRFIGQHDRPDSYGTANDGHVVLLGDSIFDNAAYTKGAPDVAQRLHSMLGENWKVTLAARDGATTGSLSWQLDGIPEDATHLVVSVGGNDANGNWKILRDNTFLTMRTALDQLYYIGALFAFDYAEALTPLLDTGLPLMLCTIYGCDFPAEVAAPAAAALTVFNDAIIKFALDHRLPILDLRSVCFDPGHFEMDIEPSAEGGALIGQAIARRILSDNRS